MAAVLRGDVVVEGDRELILRVPAAVSRSAGRRREGRMSDRVVKILDGNTFVVS